MIEGLQRAQATQDLDELGKLAHRIKGSSGSMGAEALSQAAFELESVVRNQNAQELERVIMRVLDEYQNVHKALG